MGATILTSRVGRPRATPKTVRVSSTGSIRLSPDLCIAESFLVTVVSKISTIVLTASKNIGALNVYYSSKASRSGLLSAVKVFTALNIQPKDVAGVYPAKVDGDNVVIDLRKRISV